MNDALYFYETTPRNYSAKIFLYSASLPTGYLVDSIFRNKETIKLEINSNKINLSDGIPESKLSEVERVLNILMGRFGF